MSKLSDLLQSGPTELRRYGLAVDGRGRLVSIHEARAAAERATELYWRWPYRARVLSRLPDVSMARRLGRGTRTETEDPTSKPSAGDRRDT